MCAGRACDEWLLIMFTREMIVRVMSVEQLLIIFTSGGRNVCDEYHRSPLFSRGSWRV